jgi:hypothetical protein
MKSVRWVGHVAFVRLFRKAYSILIREPKKNKKEKRRRKRRLDDNIKKNV